MAQRVRRYRCRLNPYQEYPLPPSENCDTKHSDLLPDCDMATMHDMKTFTPLTPVTELENEPMETPAPVPAEPLDATFRLSDVTDGFISITDCRLARQEPVWILTPQNLQTSQQMQLYTATQSERTVYEVRWEGGGKITTRIM
ncbi:E4 ORF6/7 [simian adenovirus 55]|uniref:E4 ORF6/7 n=1 Tax=simian adenovirus 55 TaxID=2848082 RepID=A0A1L3INZ1_9ADEN|nr:E4 ORF6/7 [Simian mastadenovirus WIV19]APG53818.1 E4 ORF6/7 [Simian mastadenovirus WIV19]